MLTFLKLPEYHSMKLKVYNRVGNGMLFEEITAEEFTFAKKPLAFSIFCSIIFQYGCARTILCDERQVPCNTARDG